MNAVHTSKLLKLLAGALLLGLALAPSSWAAFGESPAQVLKGTVQSIDYLHHAITINGQIYAVAANASYSGVAGFSVLHIGMPIAYTLRDAGQFQESATQLPPPSELPLPPGRTAKQTRNSGAAVITSIAWLPGGA